VTRTLAALRRALPLALLGVLGGATAQAHLLNMTRIDAAVDAAGVVEVQVQVDLNRAAGGGEAYYALSRLSQPLDDPGCRALLDRLVAAIELDYGGVRIPLVLTSARFAPEGRDSYLNPLSWPMTALALRGSLPPHGTGAPPVMKGRLAAAFRFEEPIALTLMRLPEHRSLTRWLVADQWSPPFDPDAAPAAADDETPWWRYVVFGTTHILPRGLDHVLFVLGLYFGARRPRALIAWITGFTLAHSVTLGLAGLGLLRLSPRIVEPLIALSIAWIGIENLLPRLRDARHRLAVVFAFGLLHGLGFASALSQLQTPRGSFLLALLGFNAGIELGQLGVIAIAFVLTGWALRQPWYRARIALPASLLIAATGLAWTVQRLLA